jgi:PAS domain S-box-containing protein
MNASETDLAIILLADGDPEHRAALTAMLADQGYRLEAVESGESALQLAHELQPELILLGNELAALDAFQVCERLKADSTTCTIPVLFVGPPDRATAFAAGGVDYLSSPLEQEEVRARVGMHLALNAMSQQLKDRQAQLEQAIAERLQIEEALADAEQQGQALLENISDVLYTVNKDGIITYISPAIENFLGYHPSEIIDHHFRKFFHPDELPRLQETFPSVLSGRHTSNEYRVLTKSGEVRWMRSATYPAWEQDRIAGAQGSLKDITDQKQAEAEIQQQNEFLNRILASLTHPFYVLDANDYTILIANPAARMVGLTGQTTCYALTHRRDSPCASQDHPCPVEEIKRTKGPVMVEHVHYDYTGARRNVEVHGYPLLDGEGNVVRVIEYSLDVTERKLAEQALRESEARWRSLTENSPDHVIVLDTDLKIQLLNHPSPGLTVEELIGTPLYTLVAEEQQPEVKASLEGVLRSSQPDTYETVYDTGDGGTIYYESRVVPRFLDGTVTGLVVSSRDITERKEAERDLQQAKESAEQARREERERRREAERRRRIADGLAGVVAALNSNQSLHEVLDHIAMQAGRLLENQAVAIVRLQANDEAFVIEAAQGLTESKDLYLDSLPGSEFVRMTVTSCQPRVVPDLAAAGFAGDDLPPGWAGAPSGSQMSHYRALLAVPIVVKDEPYGAIVLYYREPWSFSDEEVELAAIFSDQVALAVENDRLLDQIRQAAVIAERGRLSRDLHDSVTQSLFSASLVAEVLPQVWKRDPEEALDGVEELRVLVRGALSEMRTMLLELRPTALLETKLDDLLRQLAEAVTGRSQIRPELHFEPVPDLPNEVHVTFYRVAQEALHNAVKHARAGEVIVSLRASPPLPSSTPAGWRGQVILHVSDDGQGFDAGGVEPGQLGLAIMRERAEAVGAVLTIEGQSGQGTQVTLIWQDR